MISIIITAFKEEKTIRKAIESFLNQNIKEKIELIVACPDKETKKVVDEFSKKDKRVKHFNDPGNGKSYALNLLFKQLYKKDNNHILILSDGDVHVDNDSVNEIMNKFKDPKVGCVSGRPVATNKKNNMIGYFNNLLLDAGAHKIRNEYDKKNKFIECTGYLFAFRNGLVKEIPLDVAEDSIIPYFIWKQDYKIKYASNAKVYITYPNNLKGFIKQRKRAGVGSHSKLGVYYKDFPKVKSFYNEIKKGTIWALSYPKNLKEFFWTLFLFFIRLYIWIIYYIDVIFKNKKYTDSWERVR